MNNDTAAKMILAMAAGMIPNHLQPSQRKTKRKLKECANPECSIKHDHKNRFCSSLCYEVTK